MPEHPADQPVSADRGMTLVELMVGVAVLGTVVLVIGGLFKAGIVSYDYSMRQLTALSRCREALSAGPGSPGIATEARAAGRVASLSSERLWLVSPGRPAVEYRISEEALWRYQAGSRAVQAHGFQALEARYYAIDETGRLGVATDPDSAALVLVQLTARGCPRGDCVYLSAAALRNR